MTEPASTTPEAPGATHDRTIDRVQLLNVIVFVLAAGALFLVAIQESSRLLGIVLLCWLAVFGSGALWLDHVLLNIARRARGDVPFRSLFGRALRKNLKSGSVVLFDDPADLDAYRVAYGRILRYLVLSCALLFVLALVVSWRDLADIHYVMFRATAPTL